MGAVPAPSVETNCWVALKEVKAPPAGDVPPMAPGEAQVLPSSSDEFTAVPPAASAPTVL